MIDEVEEIMDESEIFNPKEYMKKSNIPTILAFLPKLYENNLQDFDASMYVQFCFYKKDWVLAGFKNGDGALGTMPEIADNYDNALFVKTITDTGIGNNIDINSTPLLSHTLEAKAIGECLKELFNFVSSGYGAALQKHRSVSWYVKGVRK